MTAPNATLSYAGPAPEVNCPLCHKRPAKKFKLYGHPVCKKCYYAFANRRQIAYVIDAILITVPNVALVYLTVPIVAAAFNASGWSLELLADVIAMPLICLFMMKDGFGGRSPGKYITDVQVLDDASGTPISFGQSFKRYWFLLLGFVPKAGGLVSGILVIIAGVQLAKGYRIGDKFAHTRVIWRRYAHLPLFGGNALVCESCGYDLRANTSGICPECGTAVSGRNAALLATGNAT